MSKLVKITIPNTCSMSRPVADRYIDYNEFLQDRLAWLNAVDTMAIEWLKEYAPKLQLSFVSCVDIQIAFAAKIVD